MKKSSKRWTALLLVLMMLLSVLTGCGGGGGSTEGDTTEEWDGTITIVQSSDIINWDPCASTDVNTKNCLKNMVNRCFETDDYYNPIPNLVKNWTNPDELTWEFELHQGVMFMDGTELTSEDVKATYERAREKSSSGKTLFGPVQNIEIIDEYNFRITTAYPYASMTTAMSNTASSVISKEWLAKVDAGECTWDDVMRNGITGRYYLGERVIGDSVELIKNENYFNNDVDGAKNEKLIFRVIPEATTRTIMLQTGEADVNVNFDTATMADVENDERVTILQHESSDIYYLALNCEVGPFTNPALRKAVNYAINREDCLQVGTEGLGKVHYNVWGPRVIGSSENPEGYSYDPEKAKSILEEAGLKDVAVKACVYNDEGERVVQVVQSYLQAVGINMTYQRIDNTILTEVVGNNEYDLVVDHTASYKDPELFFGRYFSKDGIGAKNYAHYNNEEVNKVIAEASSTLDEATRLAGYTKANEMINADAPWVPLYNNIIWAACRTGVTGVNLSDETTYYYHTICYE